jgi:hypothetical protein
MSDTIRETIIKDFMTAWPLSRQPTGTIQISEQTVFVLKRPWTRRLSPAASSGPERKQPFLPMERTIARCDPHRGSFRVRLDQSLAVSEQILGDIEEMPFPAGQHLIEDAFGWVRSPDYFDSLTYSGGGTESYPEEGQKTVGASVLVEVGYTERIGDPYSQ